MKINVALHFVILILTRRQSNKQRKRLHGRLSFRIRHLLKREIKEAKCTRQSSYGRHQQQIVCCFSCAYFQTHKPLPCTEYKTIAQTNSSIQVLGV